MEPKDEPQDNEEPLLKEENEIDFNLLESSHKSLLDKMEEISNLIDQSRDSTLEETNKLKEKMQDLQDEMKTFFKNYEAINKKGKSNLDEMQSMIIETMSKDIYSRYNEVNQKFSAKVEVIKQDLDKLTLEESNQPPAQLSQILKGKVTSNLERLQEVQKEYKNISEMSKNILKISEDMKNIVLADNDKIDELENQGLTIEDNIIKGNNELKQPKTEWSKGYWCFALILLVVIGILIAIIYHTIHK